MTETSVNFNLTFTGTVDLEGDLVSGPNGNAMSPCQLRENLESMVNLAVSDGLVTHNSQGTLDAHDYQISISSTPEPLHTFTYAFVRTERHEVDALAVLRLTVLNGSIQSKEDALETLEYCLLEWAKTCVDGWRAFEQSSRDFNIGDLSMAWPDQGLRLILERSGLAIDSLETVEPMGTQNFDRHLIDEDEVLNDGDEVFYQPKSGDQGEFVKIVSYGLPMTTVRGKDGQTFDVYPEELS